MEEENKDKEIETVDERGIKYTKGHRFAPGQSGNPAGRTKGTLSITEAIRSKLKENPEGQDKTYLELMIQKIFYKAIKEGDTSIIKEIINRTDGATAQKIDFKNQELKELTLSVREILNKNDYDTEPKARIKNGPYNNKRID